MKGLRKKTRYTESVILRQLILFAISRNMLATDPMRGVKLKKPKPTPQPCWTPEEVERILASSPPDVRPAFTILTVTGLRFGELSWLTWSDVDFAKNVLHVQPKTGWKPKTGDRRWMPLSPAARSVLESLPQHTRWVVTMPPTRANPDRGRQWTERRLLGALKRVLKQVGLVGKLHTFRHAFISLALLENTAVATVKNWVGHVDPNIIDQYTHVHDAASQAAMKKLSDSGPKAAKP